MIREHFLTTADRDAWQKYLPASRSVFGSLGYARICEAFRNYAPRLYALESGEATICYPIFLRSLADLPFVTGVSGRWDSTTPDFTGPMLFGDDPELAGIFPELRSALFREEGIVAEFAHLHPWSQVVTEERIFDREIVWVDVASSPEILWRDHLNRSCKRGITRAEREGVKVFLASSDDHIREFCRVYYETMDRTGAASRYYFPYEFFAAFRDKLPQNSRFVMAEYRDRVVAATLCLYDDNDVFEFLGGSDSAFQQLNSFSTVIWEAIRWAHGTGRKRLVLGGAYKPGDGVFQYKANFSRLRQPFYVHKQIHREEDYATLERCCREHNGVDADGEPVSYFPVYRYQPSQSKLIPA